MNLLFSDFVVPAPILFRLEHFLEFFSSVKTFLAGWFYPCEVVASGGNKFVPLSLSVSSGRGLQERIWRLHLRIKRSSWKKRKKTTCTVSWAIALISSFFQFSFEVLIWGGFLVGLWRVGLMLPECGFLAQPLGGGMSVWRRSTKAVWRSVLDDCWWSGSGPKLGFV